MLAYSIVGALFGAAAVLLFQLVQSKEIKGGKLAGTLILLFIGCVLIAFAVDWCYASIVEGEPQAAAIGLLVFGGIGAVFALIGARLMLAKPKEEVAAK